MECYENTRVADWMFKELQRKLFERSGDRASGPLHASDLYQCHRKVVLQRRQPVPHSRDAILKFAVGFAVQEWFFGPEEEGEEVFGVVLSADRLIKGQVLEFKTTRRSYETYQKDENDKLLKHLPKAKFDPEQNDGWVLRCRAYCAAHGVRKAHIGVFFLYQNDLHCWTLEFSDEELEEARQDIETRRDQLNAYLEAPGLPPVSTRMGSWECGYCQYIEHCVGDLKAEGLEVQE